MNPRPLLWLLLAGGSTALTAGCAAPTRREPPPPLPAPSACPMGHAELQPGPVGRAEIATFESAEPRPIGLRCARCGYELPPGNRVWTREAASFEGFANPPSSLLRRVRARAPDATDFSYAQTSFEEAKSETLSFTSGRDLWPILREELDALSARGGFTEKGSSRGWEGRLGDLELKVSVSPRGGGSRLLILLRPPIPPGEIERAFRLR